jgi:hypothetical protein
MYVYTVSSTTTAFLKDGKKKLLYIGMHLNPMNVLESILVTAPYGVLLLLPLSITASNVTVDATCFLVHSFRYNLYVRERQESIPMIS